VPAISRDGSAASATSVRMDFITPGRARHGCSLALCTLVVACADPPASIDTADTTDASGSDATASDATGTVASTTAATEGSTGADDHAGSSDEGTGESGDTSPADPDDPELPYDPEQLDEVCARGNADPIAQALCSDPAPTITDLVGLYDALGLELIPAHFALLSSSTSLAARSVSAINPRAMVVVPFEQGFGAVTFSRGEQVVEMVGYDQAADQLNFYLFTFFRGCNEDEAGCDLAQMFTPKIESEWTQWSLYQDIDLENRTLDCNTCHQPAGPGTEKLLLSHQSTEPWLHWFPGFAIETPGDTPSSLELTPVFLAMHGAESRFAGIPVELLTPPNPAASGIVMQQLLDNYWGSKGGPPGGFTAQGQPHVFDSRALEVDIAAGTTTTWDAYYAETLTGERLPVPYHGHDITDPTLREAAVASYTAVLAGEAAPATLVDPRAVLTAQTEAELGFRPRPGADAPEILHHVCQRCHNDELDQSLSRARFNAERPDQLTDEQRAAALARLMAPEGSHLQMPPGRFASLPEEEKQTLIEFLQP
jgi:hypothetical protein